jgi:hypothetical protein
MSVSYNIGVRLDHGSTADLVPYIAYYWLQLPPYHSPEDRLQLNGSATPAELVPPFLACDTEGRVIRLETFSKVRPCVVIPLNLD